MDDLARENEVEVAVQINGKVRARLVVPAGLDKDGLQQAALDDPKVQEFLREKTVVKVVAVPEKLVNIVVK